MFDTKKMFKITKMFKKNVQLITKEKIKELNPNQPEIPDHSYRILIAGVSGPGKTNSLI